MAAPLPKPVPGPAAPTSSAAPLSTHETAETAFLSACKARDFEVLQRLGGGCNGDVFLVRCLKAGHPFPDKLYALKAVKNYANLSSGGLRIRYEAEFDIPRHSPPLGQVRGRRAGSHDKLDDDD